MVNLAKKMPVNTAFDPGAKVPGGISRTYAGHRMAQLPEILDNRIRCARPSGHNFGIQMAYESEIHSEKNQAQQ
jgi:hypothetical protein